MPSFMVDFCAMWHFDKTVLFSCNCQLRIDFWLFYNLTKGLWKHDYAQAKNFASTAKLPCTYCRRQSQIKQSLSKPENPDKTARFLHEKKQQNVTKTLIRTQKMRFSEENRNTRNFSFSSSCTTPPLPRKRSNFPLWKGRNEHTVWYRCCPPP